MKWHLAASLILISLSSLAWAFPQETTSPRDVSSTQMADQIVKKIAPVYPAEARRAHIQGTVVLKVEISKSGDVEQIQLVSGHPMLAPAAIDSVKQWKYKPYLLNGEPVDVETRVTVNFTLADTPPAEGVVGDAPGGSLTGEPGGITSNAPLDADRPGTVRVSQGVMSGLVVTKVPPDYPSDAKKARIQGTVVMRVKIDKAGDVSNIQLISGHPLLAPAAIDAVKQWKYKPYLLNGGPVEVDTQVTVNFTLAP
jgi:TonB family protein